MIKKLFIAFFTIALSITITGCSEENSITDTGGGTATGDGGANSAQYAGTYKGALNVTYSGSGVPKKDDSLAVTLVIASDGTVKLTGKDIDVNGIISGTSVAIDIKIIHKETGLSCNGTAEIRGTVGGANVTGPITGGAECTVLAVDKKTANLTGSINVTKQ